MEVLQVGEAKKRFSELMSRVVYKGDRFLIERRGKPMAAVVSAADLEKLEKLGVSGDRPGGLLGMVGAWGDVPDEEIDSFLAEVYAARERDTGRPVTLEP